MSVIVGEKGVRLMIDYLIDAKDQAYVTCNLCHKKVPEISKQTEPPYRFHPGCRPEVVAKREAKKEARHAKTTEVE